MSLLAGDLADPGSLGPALFVRNFPMMAARDHADAFRIA